MILLDHHTVTHKDIFLKNLQGEDIEFGFVENNNLPVFFWVCQNLNLLEFVYQREHRGTLARFKILRPFKFYMKINGGVRQQRIIDLKENDLLTVTEILMTHDYYREPDPDNKRYLHQLHFDFPQQRRNISYRNFNYEM